MKVLIVRTDRLGDVVLTLPMTIAIKKSQASAVVSFLVNHYTRDVVERSSGVNNIIAIIGKEGVFRLSALMRSAKADVVLIPSPSFNLALAALLAGIPIRIGTAYRWYSFLFNKRVKVHRREGKYHEAEHNLRMLTEIGIAADPSTPANIQLRMNDHARVDDWLIERFGKTSAKFAVLHAPTRGSSKEWPHEKFITLAKEIEAEFGYAIVLTGVYEDKRDLEQLRSRVPTAYLFVGYAVAELAALLSRAKVVVSNSTGPGHLAAALGTPSIGLFPLPRALAKERWGFRGEKALNLSPQPIDGCPSCNNCSCMERIVVTDVMNAVRNIVNGKRT